MISLLSYFGKTYLSLDKSNVDCLDQDSTTNLAGTCLISQTSTHVWIVDSAATDHICNDLSFFTNCKDVTHFHHHTTIPDGTKFLITKIGDIKLNNSLTLKNDLYIPQFQFNLISISQLRKNGTNSVILSKNSCLIQDQLMRGSLPLGKMFNSHCYTLDNTSPPLDSTACKSLPLAGVVTSPTSIELAKTWHLHIGHAPLSKITILHPEINISHAKQQFFCTTCLDTRQHNTTAVLIVVPQRLHLLELLHIDTLGPYSHHTYNGCTLFFSIVNDYTKIT